MPVPLAQQMYRYVMGSGGGVSNLLLGSEELGSTGVGRWNQLLMNAVNANVSGVANPLNSDETVDQLDFQADKRARITQDVTLVAGTEYTFSVWARAASGTQDFRLSYWDYVGRNFGTSAHTASATWSPTTGRYSFTFTAATSGTFSMYIQNSSADPVISRRIYFWGAMLNVGATAADYVKTEFIGPSSPATPPMEFGDNFAGVTAYYSLRRFTRGADNNAIRVRRSSDDTEQDIGFDANGDLDTTALLAFVGTGGTDNGFVTTWYDQSGNGKNATNATASAQPKIVDGGTLVTEGGKAALDLSSTTYFDLASLTGAFNLFSVISLADKQYVFSKSTDSNMYMRQRTFSGTPTYRYRKTVSDYQFASHIVNTRFLFNFNVSNNFVKQNGSQNTNTASTPSEMSIDRLFASSSGLNTVSGIVQEFILLEDGNNNDAMESNIDTYFDII